MTSRLCAHDVVHNIEPYVFACSWCTVMVLLDALEDWGAHGLSGTVGDRVIVDGIDNCPGRSLDGCRWGVLSHRVV